MTTMPFVCSEPGCHKLVMPPWTKCFDCTIAVKPKEQTTVKGPFKCVTSSCNNPVSGPTLTCLECCSKKFNPLHTQVGGDHYKRLGPYQPWRVAASWLTPEELRGYAKGTVLAYLSPRGKSSDPDEDLDKAMHTLQLYKELRKKGTINEA